MKTCDFLFYKKKNKSLDVKKSKHPKIFGRSVIIKIYILYTVDNN